jgi:hypothetical protein
MDLTRFRASIAEERPPDGLTHALQALWWDIKGDWGEAHRCAQAQEDATGAWVHAYLHRREGDADNAGYWYRRAGRPAGSGPLDAERDAIVRELLGSGS